MLEKIKRLNNRGQMLLLDALLIPLLIAFIGAVLDLGWYYLTVSRMQNAADAAVVAGAEELLSNGDDTVFSDYTAAYLIDFVPNYLLKDNITSDIYIDNGDEVAMEYVKKNLAQDDATWTKDTIPDAYSEDTVSFSRVLWGSDARDFKTLYYQVVLREDVEHFFLPGWFKPMHAVVQSVAKITRYTVGDTLFNQMKTREILDTYESWTAIRQAKGTNKAADDRSVLSTGNWYTSVNKYRTETLRLNGLGGTNTSKYGNPATTKGTVDQTAFDDLFIDWQADINGWLYSEAESNLSNTKSSNEWSSGAGDKATRSHYRIYGTINIESTYPVRDYEFYKNKKSFLTQLKKEHPEYNGFSNEELARKIAKEPPDPLFARIESEPMNRDGGFSSSVHQIIINVDTPNTNKYTSGKHEGEYRDRPIVFFYEGPEDMSNQTGGNRASLPVILNIKNDFRGILFAPNSPVAVVGHNKNFQGFVVGSCFVELAEASDFTAKNGRYYKGSVEYYKISPYGFVMFVDAYGNVQYKTDGDGNYLKMSPTISAAGLAYQTNLDADDNEYIESVTGGNGSLTNSDENTYLSDTSAQDFYDAGLDPSLKLESDEDFYYKYAYLLNKKFYGASQFDLASSIYDSFYLVRFGRYIHLNTAGSLDNMFTTDMTVADAKLNTLLNKVKAGQSLSNSELNTLLSKLRAEGFSEDDLAALKSGTATADDVADILTQLNVNDSTEYSTYVR